MTDDSIITHAPWWKLSVTGYSIHVNDDGSYWWWDRARMFVGRHRPYLKFRNGQFAQRGRLSSYSWYGRCTPWEEPVTVRAFTYSGLNKKSRRSELAHIDTCESPDNHPSMTRSIRAIEDRQDYIDHGQRY